MIRPFSIALLYGGEKAKSYAKIMQHIINEYAQYYPLIPVIVESTTISQRLNDYNHNIIFEMLDECDFAYFFLTSSFIPSPKYSFGIPIFNPLTSFFNAFV